MVLIVCNCTPEEAGSLGRSLVEERLAACVNRVRGVTSTYAWKGAIHEDTEDTLWIKTTDDRVEALVERLRALHSYETPEILVLPVDVDRSDPAYIAWVRSVTRS